MDAPLPLFIERLLDADKYPHPTTQFEVIQTHLSWVILTGPYVYKIKKPLSFGFQDFTTLDKRHYYCDLEVILNQRYTQGLYERVLPITGTPEAPVLEGEGEPFEYAIRIKQFKQEDLLSEVIKTDQLTPEIIMSLAKQTALFHMETEVCTERMAFGDPTVAQAPVMDNFRVISEMIDGTERDSILAIQQQAQALFTRLQPLMAQRKAAGFVRACHGDMHLANAVLTASDRATFFDCIEFNESFRHTDVISDVAFMIMDLQFHGRHDLANLFLNTYLEYTGDYEGVGMLNYYCAYRAMVRAKIAVLEGSQQSGEDKKRSLVRFGQYRDLAATYFTPQRPDLSIMFGVSGSGKSTFSAEFMQEKNAIRLRSDIERKRLADLPTHSPCPEALRERLYAPDMSDRTFARLAELSSMLLQMDWPVVVDAAFLKVSQRQDFHQLAKNFDCPFTIFHCQVSEPELHRRLNTRAPGPSDADVAVAQEQMEYLEPLTAEELPYVTIIS